MPDNSYKESQEHESSQYTEQMELKHEGVVEKTKRTIRNCPPMFRLQCPKRWEALTVTDAPDVRHCEHCQQHVYFCSTDEEIIAHARAGRCIALEVPDESELSRMYLLGKLQEQKAYDHHH